MARSIPARINPDMLVWARETARLSLPVAAARIGVDEGELAAWEEGEPGLTIAKLQKVAEAYRRPLAAFFLSERPEVHERVRDFRRLPGTARSWGPFLASEIRRAEQQRDDVIDVLELRGEEPRSKWRTPIMQRGDLASAARSLLRANALGPPPNASSKPTDWFFFWSSALEEVGVLVITMNAVDPKEARGFSIAADPVPVIAVNGSEHFNGRTFTLMHEYAHLLLNSSGLCDLHETRRAGDDRDELEVQCNRIAAEILVPSHMFESRPIVQGSKQNQEDWQLEVLKGEARAWGVSPEVILRRLVDLGRATRKFYERWRERTDEKVQLESWTAPRKTNGGDGLRTKVRNLGKGYVRLVVGTYNEGLLTTYETANLLNSKTDAIPKLLARAGGPEGD